MKTKVFVALAIGVLFGVWGAHAQDHAGPPGRTPEEECRRECHIKHCDEWVACIGAEDQARCQVGVTEKELKCVRSCEPPRG